MKLFDGEFTVCRLVWQNEPISSRRLSELLYQALGWKRTTAYTALKRLAEKGVLQNTDGVVTSLISAADFLSRDAKSYIVSRFDGDISAFFHSALEGLTLSDKEARELKHVIDAHREKKDTAGDAEFTE